MESIIHMRTLHLGPEELLVAAKIAVNATATGEEVAKAIDAAERRVRSAVPIARVIYLEPDLLRPSKERGERTASTPRPARGWLAGDRYPLRPSPWDSMA